MTKSELIERLAKHYPQLVVQDAQVLVRTILDNGLRGVVLPDHVAISDHDGSATLRLSGSIGGHALIAGATGIDVPTMRLDTWVRALRIDVDAVRYVKIDTQGHEAHVFAGAPELLARPGVVWELEFSPRHLQKAGREPAALIAHMRLSRARAEVMWSITPAERREVFYAELLSSLDAAKELRLLGLGDFFRRRMLVELTAAHIVVQGQNRRDTRVRNVSRPRAPCARDRSARRAPR